jgi:hypothetical protein
MGRRDGIWIAIASVLAASGLAVGAVGTPVGYVAVAIGAAIFGLLLGHRDPKPEVVQARPRRRARMVAAGRLPPKGTTPTP